MNNADSTADRGSDSSRAGESFAIVFDLDDTLYLESQYTRSGLRAVGQAFAGELDVADLPDRLLRCYDSGERRHVYDMVLHEIGYAGKIEGLLRRMVDLHRTHRPTITLLPDADEALRWWSRRAKLGLISDGYLPAQEAKVEALGLAERVDLILLTDRKGPEFWKPHPWAFEETSRVLGVPATGCVYVADNPAKDFVAPNRLGWRTVRIRRAGGVYEQTAAVPGGQAQFRVSDLRDLPGILCREN